MSAIRIELLVKEFYGILSLETFTLSPNFEEFKHSHQKWYEDFINYKNVYATKFAAMIYDYTVKVVAGEMRHARRHGTIYCPTFEAGQDRDDIYYDIEYYNPNEILKAGEKIFSCDWDNGYGGVKWAMIAHAGLLYKKIDTISFIDHTVDLSHNNSVYFDKGAGMFELQDTNNYMAILNNKRDEPPCVVLQDIFSVTLSRLIDRAIVLGIVPHYIPHCESNIKENILLKMLEYAPIVYKNKPLEEIVSLNCKHNEDREDRRRRD